MSRAFTRPCNKACAVAAWSRFIRTLSQRVSSGHLCVPDDRQLETPSDTHLSTEDTRDSMGRPIIQISLKDFETRKNEIAAELWRAATEIGFFYLKDHGLSEVRSSLIALIAQLLVHASIILCLMYRQIFITRAYCRPRCSICSVSPSSSSSYQQNRRPTSSLIW